MQYMYTTFKTDGSSTYVIETWGTVDYNSKSMSPFGVQGGGGGGGHSGTEGGRTCVTYFAKGSFFKTSACPRFLEGYFFGTQVRSTGVKIPLQSMKYTRLWRRVTPKVTGLPSLLPPLAAAKHAEDYKIWS